VIPKGMLSEAALAWVITSKYLDGLPLYRQAALLGRFGGTELSRNTLAASVVRVGQAVQPVINMLRDALLDSFIVHGDETEVQVLKEPGRKAQAKSYMWVQMTEASGADGTGPPIRLFGYSPSRSTHSARTLYEGMRSGGVLMSDGYEPYAAIAEQHRLVHLGCWSHCRRYFNDALQALPKDKRGPEQLPARFIEPLLYRSDHHRESSQSMVFRSIAQDAFSLRRFTLCQHKQRMFLHAEWLVTAQNAAQQRKSGGGIAI